MVRSAWLKWTWKLLSGTSFGTLWNGFSSSRATCEFGSMEERGWR
jgi:hypothetical protein